MLEVTSGVVYTAIKNKKCRKNKVKLKGDTIIYIIPKMCITDNKKLKKLKIYYI